MSQLSHLFFFHLSHLLLSSYSPITCGIAVDEDFCFNYTAGVWKDINKSEDIDHDVEVVGWGEDERGVKYWVREYNDVPFEIWLLFFFLARLPLSAY